MTFNEPCETCIVTMVCDKKHGMSCHILVKYVSYVAREIWKSRETLELKRRASYNQGYRMAFKRR